MRSTGKRREGVTSNNDKNVLGTQYLTEGKERKGKQSGESKSPNPI